MNEVSVDVEEGIARARVDNMVVKDLVVERAGGGGGSGHDGWVGSPTGRGQ